MKITLLLYIIAQTLNLTGMDKAMPSLPIPIGSRIRSNSAGDNAESSLAASTTMSSLAASSGSARRPLFSYEKKQYEEEFIKALNCKVVVGYNKKGILRLKIIVMLRGTVIMRQNVDIVEDNTDDDE